ncbi:MAG: hypothetical protein ACI87H_003635, partial [Gammaproteobacteria bacterium]
MTLRLIRLPQYHVSNSRTRLTGCIDIAVFGPWRTNYQSFANREITMPRITLFIFALLLQPLTALASGSVVVDSLLMPAWVERGNSRIALAPGMPLKTNDQIRTGNGGKVLLKLEEGSDVKLGENVELAIESIEPATESAESVFSSTLNVLRGAFRFTTTLLGQDLRRDINIRVGAVTAGVRGTDLWGKSTGARSFV